eukprot:4973952-Pleurochrysis_carterae.AAC.1
MVLSWSTMLRAALDSLCLVAFQLGVLRGSTLSKRSDLGRADSLLLQQKDLTVAAANQRVSASRVLSGRVELDDENETDHFENL